MRNTERKLLDEESPLEASGYGEPESEQRYMIEAVKYKDHVLFKIADESSIQEIIMALPDTVRFAYISISGEHCDYTKGE